MKVLIAAIHHWHSPFQVGTHAIAREFLRQGWEVAYISAPLTPLHRLLPRNADLTRRHANHRQGGEVDHDGRLWHYVPHALLAPDNRPLLSSGPLLRHWFRTTTPSLLKTVRVRGFGHVDLLFIDSLYQSFWLDQIEYKRSAFRMADNNAGFSGYSTACGEVEARIARTVDRVYVSAANLIAAADAMGAASVELLPNGVNLERFEGALPGKPPEYDQLQGPIAVYVGAFGPWFDFELLRSAAARLPDVSFVMIGPENAGVKLLALEHDNIHALGPRPSADIPAYLRHATVGLIPFNARDYPTLVNGINPLKLYEYAASGLPVVSTDWEELRRLPLSLFRCASQDEFVESLRAALAGDASAVARNRDILRELDWSHQLRVLFQ